MFRDFDNLNTTLNALDAASGAVAADASGPEYQYYPFAQCLGGNTHALSNRMQHLCWLYNNMIYEQILIQHNLDWLFGPYASVIYKIRVQRRLAEDASILPTSCV